MAEIYNIPGFLAQLRGLDFHIGDIGEPRHVRRIFGWYLETVQGFRVNGTRVWVGEKANPRRIRYHGRIPAPKDPTKLTFFSHELEAYQPPEGGDWIPTHPYRHITFP